MAQGEREAYRGQLWPLPPRLDTADGERRRVGIEIEFSGMKVDEIVELTQELLGGQTDRVSDYEVFVRYARFGDVFGDIGVELDFAYLKQLGREHGEEIGDLENLAEGALALIARQLVPCEIVSPPLPMDQAWHLETLVSRLRQAGARGTRQAPLYAFGVHFNPELPDLEAATITAHLQAFLLLFEWLKKHGRIDLSRRMTPYIDPFGKSYTKRVLDPDYAPSMDQLIDDYLEHNPTRNRALDMLPLFAHIDEDRVRAVVDDDRVKARPTFHYRLPNCLIDEPDWALVRPWRDWLQVEALAADAQALGEMLERWQDRRSILSGNLFTDWADACSPWLVPELL